MKIKQLILSFIITYTLITILMTCLGITMGFLYNEDVGVFTHNISFCKSDWRRIEYILPGLRLGCYLGSIPENKEVK